jgi:hypothetical protein
MQRFGNVNGHPYKLLPVAQMMKQVNYIHTFKNTS